MIVVRVSLEWLIPCDGRMRETSLRFSHEGKIVINGPIPICTMAENDVSEKPLTTGEWFVTLLGMALRL